MLRKFSPEGISKRGHHLLILRSDAKVIGVAPGSIELRRGVKPNNHDRSNIFRGKVTKFQSTFQEGTFLKNMAPVLYCRPFSSTHTCPGTPFYFMDVLIIVLFFLPEHS